MSVNIRRDERVLRMHRMYESGNSIAKVAAAFGVTRQSVWELFANRGLPRRQQVRLPTLEYRGLRYTVRATGYYGCTTGDRHLLHRRIWADANGAIPDGYDIHHRDGNKLNNSLTNLECLPKAEHTRLYSPKCNQFSHKCGREGHRHDT